jgi:hypothetical protein
VKDEEYIKTGTLHGEVELELLNKDLPKLGNRKMIDRSSGREISFLRPSLMEVSVPAFGYGSYRRYTKRGLSQEDRYAFDSLFDEEASLVNAEDWLLRTDYESAKENQRNDELQRVKEVLLQLLKGEVTDIQIRKDNSRFAVKFQTRYGWVGIQQLSLGYKSLVSWMVDLASRMNDYYPNSENVLLEPAVVLVDEIDLHLHVSLQKDIVHFLRSTFPNIQFIVTAHSPLMVFGEENANLIILEKEADHVIIQENHDNVNNWRVDQVLTSELFGLDTARSNRMEHVMARRAELIERGGNLSGAERQELQKLELEVDVMPTYETGALNDAHAIILRAAAELKAQGADDQN